MKRPCTCDRVTGPEYTKKQCTLCWLYHHDPRYKRLFDGDDSPLPEPPATPRPKPLGAGGHLKRILASHWIKEKVGCKCGAHAAQMDKWGPDECERQFETIVSWMKEEAQRRKLPWNFAIEVYVDRLIWLAISRARRDQREAGGAG